jgi:hypothetical protein
LYSIVLLSRTSAVIQSMLIQIQFYLKNFLVKNVYFYLKSLKLYLATKENLPEFNKRYCSRVRENCQSCQTRPAKFPNLVRTDTRLVFCNRKIMRTDISFTRITRPICNFVNPVVEIFCNSIFFTLHGQSITITGHTGQCPSELYTYFSAFSAFIT